MSIGDNIRKYRKAAGLSRDDLSEKLNINETDIALWERGLSEPDDTLICKIANALGITAEDISEACQLNNTNIEDEVDAEIESDENIEDQQIRDFSLKIVTPIEDMLEKGENLIWVGKPSIKHSGNIFALIQIILGSAWIFVIFFSVIRFIISYPPLAIIGIPLVLFGIYKVTVKLLKTKKQKEATNYAITNRRVIIKCNYKRDMVKSINLYEIKSLRCEEGRDGTGNIIFFDQEEPSDQKPLSSFSLERFGIKDFSSLLNGFYDISDVVKVCDIFRNILS